MKIKYVFAFVLQGFRCEARLLYHSEYINRSEHSSARLQAFYAIAKARYKDVLPVGPYAVFVSVIRDGETFDFERSRLWRWETDKEKFVKDRGMLCGD